MGENPAMSSFIYDPNYVSADDRYQHLRPCRRAEAYAGRYRLWHEQRVRL